VIQPAIDLLAIATRKPDFLAGLQQPANRFQTQIFCFVRADVQSPACLILQPHLVLEESPNCSYPREWDILLPFIAVEKPN
jgi:hypothetical protein